MNGDAHKILYIFLSLNLVNRLLELMGENRLMDVGGAVMERTALNIKENEERMVKMKDGESMAERIEIYMDKVKKKKVSQLIDDCYYEEHIEQGVPF